VTTAPVAALNVIVNSVCIIAPPAQIREAPADFDEQRQPAGRETRHAGDAGDAGDAGQRGYAATAEQQALLTGCAAALGILGFLGGP